MTPSGDRLLAVADNLTVARAAFDTAASLWPEAVIELRQKARVILNNQIRIKVAVVWRPVCLTRSNQKA
jgi:hypothetical protein